MPDKIPDEKVDRIVELAEDGHGYADISQKVGVSKSTVKKYVDEAGVDVDKGSNNESRNADSGGGSSSVVEMTGSDSNLADLTDDELMDMSESEFIRTFFQEFSDTGVKDSFVELIANQANVRRQIPDEDQMSQRIQAHNSGVGNANDANAIAELYWALAQRYLRARGLASGGGPAGGMMGASGMNGGGDWVGTSAHSTQPNQQNGQQNGPNPQDAGDWVSTGPSPGQQPNQQQQGVQAGQPHQQQNGQMAQFAQMMQQMQQQQQAMMEKMMQSQQDSTEDRLESEIEELKAQLNGGGDSVTDSIQEFVELQETLDQLQDDDQTGSQTEELVGALQQQIQALRQEVNDGGGGGGMAEVAAQSDSQFGLLAALAQSGDIDANEMVDVAQKLGEVETDPNVAEKKYEKEIEEMKVQAEQEKWNSILSGLEDVADNFGEVVGAFAGGEQQQNGRAESTQQQAQAHQQTAADPGGERDEAEQRANGQSPAQQIVESNTEEGEADPVIEEAEPEPESEQVGLDDEEGLDVEPTPAEEETTDNDEKAAVGADDGDPGDVESEPEPEEAEADGGGAKCPGCGKEFETEQQVNGHKIHCDEV